ncbi:MAG: transposase [Pseudobdellovibrio sp.]
MQRSGDYTQKSKFTAEQIITILQEAYAQQGALQEVARRYGITTKTIGTGGTINTLSLMILKN